MLAWVAGAGTGAWLFSPELAKIASNSSIQRLNPHTAHVSQPVEALIVPGTHWTLRSWYCSCARPRVIATRRPNSNSLRCAVCGRPPVLVASVYRACGASAAGPCVHPHLALRWCAASRISSQILSAFPPQPRSVTSSAGCTLNLPPLAAAPAGDIAPASALAPVAANVPSKRICCCMAYALLGECEVNLQSI